MMKAKVIILTLCGSSLFLMSGCDKLPFIPKAKPAAVVKKNAGEQAAVKGNVVARVNDDVITVEELNREVENYNALVPADRPELRIDTRDKKLDYLKNELVRRILLYQEGLRKGAGNKDEVQQALATVKQNLIVGEFLKEETQNIDVTSKEIQDYYEKYKDNLKEPEQRRLRVIVAPKEEDAKQALIQLLQGMDFAEAAKNFSKDASASNGGDIGLIKKGDKFTAFDEVAFSSTLDAGKISSVFKGPDGFYIVKVEEIKGGETRSLSQLWEDIKTGLKFLKQQQKIESLIGELSRGAKIKINEELVS